MTSTTHSTFDANTEALEVAKVFSTSVHGKTILVTGANRNGIGFTTLEAFASQSPARIITAGRSPGKVKECIEALEKDYPGVEYRALQIDLSSQSSVRAAAAEVLAWSDVPAIDILVNSAGIMGIQERELTEDGIEMHFATNHIGHWLLTCLIMPKLIKASESNPRGATRIINVTSLSPVVASMRWSDINFDKKNKDLPKAEQPPYEWLKVWGYEDMEETPYIPLDGYNRSKVANVLFSVGVNRRLFAQYGITSMAVHPGVITTELSRNFPSDTVSALKRMGETGRFTRKSLSAGSSTSLVAALDPQLGLGVGQSQGDHENSGVYLIDCQISHNAHPLAVSSKEAERLWELSEKLVGQSFAW